MITISVETDEEEAAVKALLELAAGLGRPFNARCWRVGGGGGGTSATVTYGGNGRGSALGGAGGGGTAVRGCCGVALDEPHRPACPAKRPDPSTNPRQEAS